MGQSGMPDTIRTTVEGVGAHPRYSGFRAVATVITLLLTCRMTRADDAGAVPDPSTLQAYVWAVGQLDRHEIAALALTLGILCFAVVTAILLVRTRQRLTEVEVAARDESIAAKA